MSCRSMRVKMIVEHVQYEKKIKIIHPSTKSKKPIDVELTDDGYFMKTGMLFLEISYQKTSLNLCKIAG